MNIDRTYLLSTKIKRLRKKRDDEQNIAALVRRRNRLAYDEVALENFNAGEGRIASTEYRWSEHKRLREADGYWEDFLYYQNAINRWNRMDSLMAEDEQRQQIEGINQPPWMFDHNDPAPFLRMMLDHYDHRSIGGEEYRQDIRGVTGAVVRRGRGEPERRPIGPAELHLWTPITRRVPGGLRNPDEMPIITQRSRRTFQPELDLDAIAAEQTARETEQLRPAVEGEVLMYNTHAERREAERRRYLRDDDGTLGRPSTSNVRENGDRNYEESFGALRTNLGLFIAAKETSQDWLTSYDCLGKLEAGWTANIPPHDDTTDNLPRKKSTKGKGRTDEEESEEENWRLFVPKEDKKKGITRKRKAAAVNGDDDASSEDEWDAEVVAAARARRVAARMRRKESEADYDYDYEDFEFTKPRTQLKSYERLHTTPLSGEATEGRRERHMGMLAPDSSPPTSPPRALIATDVELDTIPEGIVDEELPRPERPRCPHETENCRAWWNHARENCWRANVETRVEVKWDEDPIIEVRDELLPIARGGRDIYRRRLRDHYGRIVNGEGLQWPAFGIRVPYAPLTTLDDISWRNGERGEGTAPQFPGSRSMAIPIIAESQRGWWNPLEPPGRYDPDLPSGGEDDESDDDDDTFRKSYHECSFPDGRPPSTGDPTDPPAPGGEPGPSAPDPKKPSGRPTSPR